MAEEAALSSQGWSVWVGQDLPAKRYVSGTLEVDPTYTTYTEYDTTLQFTVVAGGVSWKLASTGNTNTAAAVNNISGTVYQWIAFGLPSEV